MLSQPASKTGLKPNQTPEPPPSPSSSQSLKPSPPKSPQQKSPSLQQKSLSPQQKSPTPRPKPKRPGRKLLAFDRRLGARFIAGTDEAGRGSLAGPLVVAGVLLDYGSLRDHRVRPLALLNDSKQLTPAGREELFRAVLACCSKISVRAISAREIDSNGLHRSNLAAMRAILWELAPPAEICLVDGFRLGPTAPEHKAVVDGDEKSAAIAAASVVAKVVRDRTMRRLAALYPHYGFSSHVGYITPGHSAVVRERGPSEIHRRSFEARCYAEQVAEPTSAEVPDLDVLGDVV
ncbi:MAG TPA: ribonuclease HII [Gaiellaceae bacterium]|nr:ribonuclease HII [Gaiellaceae bacterium]